MTCYFVNELVTNSSMTHLTTSVNCRNNVVRLVVVADDNTNYNDDVKVVGVGVVGNEPHHLDLSYCVKSCLNNFVFCYCCYQYYYDY